MTQRGRSAHTTETNLSFYFRQRCENLLDESVISNPGCKAEIIVLVQLLLEIYVNYLARNLLLKVNYFDEGYIDALHSLERIGFVDKAYMLLYVNPLSDKTLESLDAKEYADKRHKLHGHIKNFARYRNYVSHGSALFDIEVFEQEEEQRSGSTAIHDILSNKTEFKKCLEAASEIFDLFEYFINIWDMDRQLNGRLRMYCKRPQGLDVLTEQ